jgi:hypothetical protein
MLRLMLKDLAMMRRQKIFGIAILMFLVPAFLYDPLVVAVWAVFPALIVVQTLEALDANETESRLLRALPLDASTVVGARYLFVAVTVAASLFAVFVVRLGLEALGSPVPILEPGIASLCGVLALTYMAARNLIFYLFGPIKARWVNTAFIFILVFGGTTLSLLTSPAQQRMPRMPSMVLDTSGFLAFARRPAVFSLALLAALALYGLSFLASARIWKAKAA